MEKQHDYLLFNKAQQKAVGVGDSAYGGDLRQLVFPYLVPYLSALLNK